MSGRLLVDVEVSLESKLAEGVTSRPPGFNTGGGEGAWSRSGRGNGALISAKGSMLLSRDREGQTQIK